jgi:CheY-like chemotaxis protein
MDYEWPTGGGTEAVRGIRASGGPNAGAYILGSSDGDSRKEFLHAGVDEFLQKPIDLATLKMRALRVASGTATVSSVL